MGTTVAKTNKATCSSQTYLSYPNILGRKQNNTCGVNIQIISQRNVHFSLLEGLGLIFTGRKPFSCRKSISINGIFEVYTEKNYQAWRWNKAICHLRIVPGVDFGAKFVKSNSRSVYSSHLSYTNYSQGTRAIYWN